jgi:hypothetical protein
MLYLGRGSSVTQCPLCEAFDLSCGHGRGSLPGLGSVNRGAGVKIIDMFAAAQLPPCGLVGLKPLNALSNFGLTGV